MGDGALAIGSKLPRPSSTLPTATLIIIDTPGSGPNCRRAEGNVRRLQATCYFTSARKLGVGSAPMSACLDTVAAAAGGPAATPRVGGGWFVTYARSLPSTIILTRVVAVETASCT